jgi:hypothetical protein
VDPSILKFAQMAGIFIATCAALACVMLVFGVASRLLRRVAEQAPKARIDDERQAKLERAVDVIAIEVERISESQRFISKVLAERPAESSRLAPP